MANTSITMEKQCESFVQDLECTHPDKAEIVKQLYGLFCNTAVQLTDHFIYGGIGMYSGKELIGGIYVSKHHVSLVFSRGNELIDTYNVLEGKGQFRRHIKIQSLEAIKTKYCKEYIEQLVAL